jgi:hypothetical protein
MCNVQPATGFVIAIIFENQMFPAIEEKIRTRR